MLAVLTVISIIAAGVLAAVNAITAPQIEKINADNLAAGIKDVMQNSDIQVSDPAEADGFTAYDISDASGHPLGKAVVTTENGFGGALKVLVGFDTTGKILGYTVLEHSETPGLGAKAGEWFQDKVVGLNPGECNFTVSKDGGDVDAITASTITSRAFLKAIKNAYDKYFAGASCGADAESGATKQDTKCKSGDDCCADTCSAADIEKPEAME